MRQAQRYTAEGIEIHSKDDFNGMRKAGRLAAEVLDMITPHVVPGATTEELDQLCRKYIETHGAIPAPLNYKGFRQKETMFLSLAWSRWSS